MSQAQTVSDLSARPQIEVIGSFLRILFTEKKFVVRIPRSSKVLDASSTSQSDTLYSTSNFSQSKLMHLVLHIYKGPPEPFEYLRCCHTTTEQELSIFMKRAHEHPRMYIIIHVNSLPHHLQEVSSESSVVGITLIS